MSDRHIVITPEKVVLSSSLATIGSRTTAKVIDLIIFACLAMAVVSLFMSISALGPLAELLAQGAASIIAAFSLFAYFIVFEALMKGQTPGKMACRLRVTMADGTPVTPLAAFYRNTILIADLTLPLISLPVMFLSERAQRPGDFPAGTVVVHEPRARQALAKSPHRYGVHPHEELVGPLKGMTMEEYLAIKRLCDRFPDLNPSVQERSINDIWVPFAKRFKIPSFPDIHPIYLMEATIMKYGRMRNLV